MTEDELMQMYGMLLAQAFQGSTPSNQLNLVQDVLGTAGISLMPQQPDYPIPNFQVDPDTGEPIGAIESVYGNNPVWQGIFNTIDEGETPEAAVAAAINQGLFEELDDTDSNAVNRYLNIGRDYATERFQNAQAFADFQEASRRAEEGVPVSLMDVFNPPSQYERLSAGMGKPEGVAGEDLLRAYAVQNAGRITGPRRGGRTLQDVRLSQRAAAQQPSATTTPSGFAANLPEYATMATGNAGTSAGAAPAGVRTRGAVNRGRAVDRRNDLRNADRAAPYDVMTANDEFAKTYRANFIRNMERQLGRARNVAAPSPQAQRAAQTVAFLSALLGGR